MARKKGGILTLLFALLLLVLSILGFTLAFASAELPKNLLKAIEPARSFIVANFAWTGEEGKLDPLVIPSVFLLLESIMTIVYRRRKPFSLIFSSYLYVVYFSFLAFFHLEAGLETPAFIMSRIDMSKRPLIAVLLFLECLLAIVLKYVTTGLDRKWKARHMELDRDTFEERLDDSAEVEADIKEGKRAKRAEKREIRRAQKERLKAEEAEKKAALQAEREAEKENKALLKAEKKRKKQEEKERRKEEKTLDVDEEFVTTAPDYEEGQIPIPPRAEDGSSPLDFPSLSEIPRMDTIEHVRDIDRVSESEYDRMQRNLGVGAYENEEPVRPMYQSTFQVDPVDIPEDKDDEDSFIVSSRPEVKYDPRSRNNHFKAGGMLEATIESLNDYDEKKRQVYRPLEDASIKEVIPSSKEENFAPSGLSKDHPRYKLFESLRNSGPESARQNVSHMPSMPFKAEQKGEVGSYGSTYITENEQKIDPSRRMLDMKQNSLDSTNPRVQVPSSEISSLERTRVNSDPPVEEKRKERRTVPQESKQEEKVSFREENEFSSVAVRPDEEKRIPSHNPFEKKKELIEKEDIPFDMPVAARKAEDIPSLDEEHKGRYDDGSDYVKQENELQYTFGIVGLQSNNAGMTGIRERARMKYIPPTTDILLDYPSTDREIDEYTIQRGENIVATLKQFRVDVHLENIIKGPTVTMYEVKLAEGTPVSKVKSRYDDISYNLGLGNNSLRILAPIPGKQAIGIEIPNRKRAVIGFKDMLEALEKDDKAKQMALPMILGRTITGAPVIIDVAKTPHLLIAGSTGSGKSVGINAFISTLLYKKSPRDVRLILIDPKVVELTMYNGIPHLLTPVITESKKVQKVLAWLTEEMDRRYKMISMFNVRNITAFNEKLAREKLAAEKLPYIVLIMDEYADLMATIGKDIEFYVGRLTAMARAVGIHLVLATQRPSAEVVTGTIKNNIPSRIAFAVSSGMNSKIILDEMGAESLLGKGDMLYKNPSSIDIERIQGAFLSDRETEEIVEMAKRNGEPDYLDEAIFEDFSDESDDDYEDDLFDAIDNEEEEYERAKQIVYEKKSASASYLQRRMKIGYNKAARYVERMEEEGIVGPPNGSKPRELLKMM